MNLLFITIKKQTIDWILYRSFAVWEVRRDDEFSPLKNGAGNKDTAETCRRDLLLQHKRFVKQAGAVLDTDDSICEISPLVSYAGEVKIFLISFQIFYTKYSSLIES